MDTVDVLVFDVLGTVVDEHGSIRDELAAVLERHGTSSTGAAGLEARWRARVGATLDSIRAGTEPYDTADAVNRRVAAEVCAEAGLTPADGELDELGRVGHRLRPWPDSVGALQALARRFPLVALSNGNRSMLLDMSAAGGLGWHLVISGEEVGAYKPASVVYARAVAATGRRPERLLMVAAHPWDLRAAAAAGLRTAYVRRPESEDPAEHDTVDLAVDGLSGLASALGC